jgi:hypothetical protein
MRATRTLAASLSLIILLEAVAPRVYPAEGGLLPRDVGLMALLPIGAHLAGRHECQVPETFAYGAAGATLFAWIACSDEFSLGCAVHLGTSTLPRLCLEWLAASVAAGAVCCLLARRASLPRLRTIARTLAGLCPACAYDLRAHAPGARCPECGRPVTRPPARPLHDTTHCPPPTT